jgi:hypothetical protein
MNAIQNGLLSILKLLPSCFPNVAVQANADFKEGWYDDQKCNVRQTHLFSICKAAHKDGTMKGYSIVIGPFRIAMAYRVKTEVNTAVI